MFMKICKMPNCNNPSRSNDLCQKHYQRFYLYGDPNTVHRIIGNDTERFYSKIDKTSSDIGCWLWTDSKTKAGYGRIMVNGKAIKAHRFSYELHKGKIPENTLVCHSCDIRHCVNPDHLWLGTYTDNNRDMFAKNRNRNQYST